MLPGGGNDLKDLQEESKKDEHVWELRTKKMKNEEVEVGWEHQQRSNFLGYYSLSQKNGRNGIC